MYEFELFKYINYRWIVNSKYDPEYMLNNPSELFQCTLHRMGPTFKEILRRHLVTSSKQIDCGESVVPSGTKVGVDFDIRLRFQDFVTNITIFNTLRPVVWFEYMSGNVCFCDLCRKSILDITILSLW